MPPLDREGYDTEGHAHIQSHIERPPDYVPTLPSRLTAVIL